MAGWPDWKCSMIAPRMPGLIWSHSAVSALVTVTKSVPKNTAVTPSTAKTRRASGDFSAPSGLGKSAVPASRTVWPGRNFRAAGSGFASVWLTMRSSVIGPEIRLRRSGSRLGTVLNCSADRFQPFFRQLAGHDRDRNGKRAKSPRQVGDDRARPALAGARAEHEDTDLAVLVYLREDFRHCLALADDELGVHVVAVAHPLREDLEMGVDTFTRLLAHEFADSDPVLEFLGRDDGEYLDTPAGLGRAHGSKAHGVQAFAAVIEHDEKLAHDRVLLLPMMAGAGEGRKTSRGEVQRSRRSATSARITVAVSSLSAETATPTSAPGAVPKAAR